MKTLTLPVIAGIILLLVGGFVFVQGGYITSRREVIDVGGIKISAVEPHPVEPWVAGIGLVLGTTLVVAGITRKR